MHIITRPRPEVLTVKFKDKTYEVRMDGDGAFVPADLGEYMVAKGLVGKGYHDDPKPSWAVNSDGSHGALIPRFSQWCKEIASQPTEGKATP
jgi:hypothetical protein